MTSLRSCHFFFFNYEKETQNNVFLFLEKNQDQYHLEKEMPIVRCTCIGFVLIFPVAPPPNLSSSKFQGLSLHKE